MNIGQVNYAVNNRDRLRKTATEVMSADAQAVKLQSVSVLNLANLSPWRLHLCLADS